MSKYLTFHVRENHLPSKGGYTVVIDKPTQLAEELDKLNKSITLNVGFTKVHSGDSYERKVGRTLAETRIQPMLLGLLSYSPGCSIYKALIDVDCSIMVTIIDNKIKEVMIHEKPKYFSSTGNYGRLCSSPQYA